MFVMQISDDSLGFFSGKDGQTVTGIIVKGHGPIAARVQQNRLTGGTLEQPRFGLVFYCDLAKAVD